MPTHQRLPCKGSCQRPKALTEGFPHRIFHLPPGHCEPVTDVTGVAIRLPLLCSCKFPQHFRRRTAPKAPLCKGGWPCVSKVWGIVPQRLGKYAASD